MNGLDLALNPNLNPPLTLKKFKIMSMIRINPNGIPLGERLYKQRLRKVTE